jgi:hypothetical protein
LFFSKGEIFQRVVFHSGKLLRWMNNPGLLVASGQKIIMLIIKAVMEHILLLKVFDCQRF